LRSQQRFARITDSKGLPKPDFVEKARQAAHTVGGAFPKVLCAEDPSSGLLYEDDPRLEPGYRRWIVKFAQDTRPYSSEMEFALNRLAKAAGISVPDARLMVSRDNKGREWVHFAIERFDWAGGERVHFSSLSSMIGHPLSDLSTDYRDLLVTTHALTRDISQVEEAFRRMIFNVAVFNTDDHAKNHGFLYRDGRWSLSPAYDITFSPGSPGAEVVRAMPVLGQSSDITMALMQKAAERAGLSSGRAVADEVTTAVIEAGKTFGANGLDPSTFAPMLERIMAQARALRSTAKSRSARSPRGQKE
jgi:serine/threonine-protein kinase HipA